MEEQIVRKFLDSFFGSFDAWEVVEISGNKIECLIKLKNKNNVEVSLATAECLGKKTFGLYCMVCNEDSCVEVISLENCATKDEIKYLYWFMQKTFDNRMLENQKESSQGLLKLMGMI